MGQRLMPTHYQTLGVPPSASSEQIRRAYRALAKSLHPDVNPAKDAAGKFARIAAAYEVLSDPRKRRDYDLALAARAAPPPERDASDLRQGHYVWVNVAAPPSERSMDISEIDELFDTFFGGSPKPRSQGQSSKTKPNKQVPNTKAPKKPRARRGSSG
jgi:DnaJ-class molecular chaperone